MTGDTDPGTEQPAAPDPASIYGAAELYDIAFDFRDVHRECDVIVDIAGRHAGRPIEGFVELAAGPAQHAREMARRGIRSSAVDLSAEMAALGLARASAEGTELDYVVADIAAFALASPVDAAAILMDSLTVLLDNDAVLHHLECVADALAPGGVYILEMSHPRDVFGVGKSTDTEWEMERDGTTVFTTWGRESDPFDPTTQITQDTVTFRWQRGRESGEITETLPNRCFTANEIRALVAASRRFAIVEELGALDGSIPFDNSKEASRYVPVLQRTD